MDNGNGTTDGHEMAETETTNQRALIVLGNGNAGSNGHEAEELEEEEGEDQDDSYSGSDGIIKDLERKAVEMVEMRTGIANREKVTTATGLTKRVFVGYHAYDMTITVKVDMKLVVFKEK